MAMIPPNGGRDKRGRSPSTKNAETTNPIDPRQQLAAAAANYYPPARLLPGRTAHEPNHFWIVSPSTRTVAGRDRREGGDDDLIDVAGAGGVEDEDDDLADEDDQPDDDLDDSDEEDGGKPRVCPRGTNNKGGAHGEPQTKTAEGQEAPEGGEGKTGH
jgi:hypothetical protein